MIKSIITNEKVANWVTEKITTDSVLDARLRKETAKLPEAMMMSPSDVGAFLQILAQTSGAKKAIEIGTFTGYTALKIAQVLPAKGKLLCLDMNKEWTDIGRKYWKEAKVDKKIDLRLGDAKKAMKKLIVDEVGTFDFAFIDADKPNYEFYYESCLELVREGGLIVLDNMLWNGKVVDPKVDDPTTKILRALNLKICKDKRVESCLLTVGDGLMLARKI